MQEVLYMRQLCYYHYDFLITEYTCHLDSQNKSDAIFG